MKKHIKDVYGKGDGQRYAEMVQTMKDHRKGEEKSIETGLSKEDKAEVGL